MKNFFSDIAASITRIQSYKEFYSRPFPSAVKYLFWLVLLLAIPMTVAADIYAYRGMKDAEKWFVQAPDFRVTNGVLSVDARMPIRFTEGLVVDTRLKDDSGAIKVLEKVEEGVLITGTKVYNKENKFQTRIYDFGVIPFDMAKKDVLNYKGWIYAAALFFASTGAFLGLIALFFIRFFFFSMVAGVMCLVTSLVAKSNLEYWDCVKLSMYALTLPLIIDMCNLFLPLESVFNFWTLSLVTLIYLILANRELAQGR